MLTVCSWNVNSLRVRLALVLKYIDEAQPDVLCLQETRMADRVFPRAPFEDRGFHVATASTGGYAGVAIASRIGIDEVVTGIEGFIEDKAPGRRIACRLGSLWIDTVYVPTRTKIGKSGFLDSLGADLRARHRPDAPLVLCGDFNICFDERDYASPSMITEPDVHPRRPEDLAFRRLVEDKLVDCFRRRHCAPGHFTWFPNTTWAVKRNYGMRLDYVFASASLADRLVDAAHDKEPRSQPGPSDHLPVRAQFDITAASS